MIINNAPEHFYKVFFPEFTNALKSVSNNQRLNVILYVLSNLDGNNLFIGTMQDVADKTEISYKTVQGTFKVMLKRNILKKKNNFSFMVSPHLLMRGVPSTKMRLIREFNEIV
jgi:hypothetical protein